MAMQLYLQVPVMPGPVRMLHQPHIGELEAQQALKVKPFRRQHAKQMQCWDCGYIRTALLPGLLQSQIAWRRRITACQVRLGAFQQDCTCSVPLTQGLTNIEA